MVVSKPSVDTSYQLEKRKLGSSELVFTEVSLGTMTWGEQNSEAEAHAQLDYAYERGVMGIDSAEMYPVPPREKTNGRTEQYIGSWIRARGGTAFREKLVLASKVAGPARASGFMSYVRGNNRVVDRKNVLAAVEGILDRLGTDYIDLLQIHWPDRYVPVFGAKAYEISNERNSVPVQEQIAVMDELIKAGKIRHYGLSNETAWGIAQFDAVARAGGYPRPISVQNSYSLINRDFDGHPAEACAPRNANMGLLAYSPLAGGALTGKYLYGAQPENCRFALFPGYMVRFQSSLAAEAIGEYKKVADNAGLTLAQLALAWCKSRWFVQSTIIGATNMEQLKENIDAFSVKLDEETLEAVNKVYLRYRDPSTTS